MSEKRKWFDPSEKRRENRLEIRYLPTRLTSASRVSVEEAASFMKLIYELLRKKRIHVNTSYLFFQLVKLHPVHRLSRNLSSLLHMLSKGVTENVIHDGLSKQELNALMELELAGVSTKVKAVAQGLLNVYERYQMLETARGLFETERLRKWDILEALHD